MSRVIIEREFNYHSGEIDYNIWLDDKNIGKLKNGQEYQTEISEGKHSLYIKATIDKSNTVDFDVLDSNTDVRIKCKIGTMNPKLELVYNKSNVTLSEKYEKLEKLSSLKEKGIITESEFNSEKEKILADQKNVDVVENKSAINFNSNDTAIKDNGNFTVKT